MKSTTNWKSRVKRSSNLTYCTQLHHVSCQLLAAVASMTVTSITASVSDRRTGGGSFHTTAT